MSHTKGIAALTIHKFLVDNPHPENNKEKFLEELNSLIKSVLTDDDKVIYDLLRNFGYNGEKFEDIVDLQRLKNVLGRKNRMLKIRKSNIGSESTTKSFVPEILMNILIANSSANSVEDSHGNSVGNSIGNSIGNSVEPTAVFFNGICLLVDISGFTRLSGAFCDKGKDGIDELQKATNGYMGKLVKCIYKYDGDVIKFAGDAVICLFSTKSKAIKSNKDVHKLFDNSTNPKTPSNHGRDSSPPATRKSPSTAANHTEYQSVSMNCDDEEDDVDGLSPAIAKNALQCAMELRNICTEELTVHVAVSLGEMCFGIVGGHNDKWESLISGDCLFELSQCLDDAPSKSCVITPNFHKYISNEKSDEYKFDCLATGNYMVSNNLDRKAEDNESSDIFAITAEVKSINMDLIRAYNDPLLVAMISKFVPYPVSLALISGTFEYLAELREVTTMFMKWDDYNCVQHRNLLSLQQYFYVAQEILAQTGGFIRQFLVDDKGCVLIACWGVPTASFIDNAFRALSASVLIRSKFLSMGMKASFGITTGNVYCGCIGAKFRREYAAIGDVVNLAARLMSKAKGCVYIDEKTYFYLSNDAQQRLTSLEPILVKGKSVPISIYSYTSSELLFLQSGEVYDSHLRVITKNILMSHIQSMIMKESTISPSTRTAKPITRKGSSDTTAMPATSENYKYYYSSKDAVTQSLVKPPMKFVLLEGKVGSGKASALKWFRLQAEKEDLRIISVGLTPKDSFIEYKAISRLFRALIGEESFDNIQTQKSFVLHVLNELYPNDKDTAENVAFPAMRIALGITCTIKSNANYKQYNGNSYYNGNNSNNQEVSNRSCKVQRLPPRLIMETLHRLFEYLLNMETSGVILEHIHYADESSLKTLLSFQNIRTQSILLMSSVDVEEYKEFYQNNSIDTLSNKVGEIRSRLKSNPTVNNLPSIDWMTSLRNRLLHYKYTSVITLTDFTKFEIDHLLRCTLKVGVIVDGLVDLVYQLSSGNPFWVFEMAEFIQSIGPEEFIDAMTQIDLVDGGRNSSSYVRALETAHIKRNATFSFSDKVFSKSEKFNEVIVHPPAKSYVKPGKNKAGAVDFQGVEKASLSIDTDSAAKENRSGSTIGKSKLTLLIVYRLEKLSSDEQHILRTAAIIGYSFSRYILYGVLSSRLKAYMYDSLKVLLKKNWICASSQEDSEYVFNHPVVYNTLYDITPQSDRIAIHRTIADYLENMHSEDPNQYKLLCEQFSYCNEEKAFEYALKAAEISLSPPELDIQKAIDMLMKGLSFVKDEVDCNTITALIEYARDIIVPLDEQDDVEDSISEKISDERKAQVYVGNRLTDSATNPPTKFLFSRVQLSTNVVYPHTVEVIDGSHSCCFFIGMWPQQRKQSPLQVSGAKERVLLSDTESVRNESSSRSILTKRKNNNNVVIFLTPTAQECFRKQLQEIERKVLMKSTTYTSLHINKLVVNGKEYYNDIVKSKHFWQLKMLGIVSIDEDDEKSYRTTDTRFTAGSKVSKQSKDKSSWRSSTRLPFR